MASKILIKPIISEKSELLSEGKGQYTFIVSKTANKLQIKDSIEKAFSVNVASVNTMIMPGKSKTRNTRSGVQKGHSSAYKKAIVSLAEGEEIDFFGEI